MIILLVSVGWLIQLAKARSIWRRKTSTEHWQRYLRQKSFALSRGFSYGGQATVEYESRQASGIASGPFSSTLTAPRSKASLAKISQRCTKAHQEVHEASDGVVRLIPRRQVRPETAGEAGLLGIFTLYYSILYYNYHDNCNYNYTMLCRSILYYTLL